MKAFRFSGILMLTCLVFMIATTAQSYGFEIGARAFVWFPDFKGNLKIDKDNVPGTTINARDDLGLGRETVPSVDVYAGLKKHHLTASYTYLDFSGQSLLARPIVFNGQTYGAGLTVNSDFTINMFDFEYQYDLINVENILAGFSLGVIAKVKYLDGEAKIRAINTALATSDDFQIPLPMVGGGLHIGILANILEGRAKFTGFGYDSDNWLYEALAELSYTPFPFLDIHGGYRIMKIKADQDNVLLDMEFSGPYVGLSVGF